MREHSRQARSDRYSGFVRVASDKSRMMGRRVDSLRNRLDLWKTDPSQDTLTLIERSSQSLHFWTLHASQRQSSAVGDRVSFASS